MKLKLPKDWKEVSRILKRILKYQVPGTHYSQYSLNGYKVEITKMEEKE